MKPKFLPLSIAGLLQSQDSESVLEARGGICCLQLHFCAKEAIELPIFRGLHHYYLARFSHSFAYVLVDSDRACLLQVVPWIKPQVFCAVRNLFNEADLKHTNTRICRYER